MGIDQADTLVGCFGGDKHDDAEVVAVGDGFVLLEVVAEREVGDNHAVNAYLGASTAKVFEAVLHDGIEVAHENEGDGDFAAYVAQLVKKDAEGHTVAQGYGTALLDDGTVGHGVGEGDTDFYHIDALPLKFAEDREGIVQPGIAGGEVDGEDVALSVLQKLIYSICFHIAIMF